jgi:hypothetical protein
VTPDVRAQLGFVVVGVFVHPPTGRLGSMGGLDISASVDFRGRQFKLKRGNRMTA